MATPLVVGAVLSGVFNVLLERLTPEQIDLINFICEKKLNNKLLNHLKPNLIAAKVVLDDAELKQFSDPAVKDWLDELTDAVYDLGDFMDEISTRAAAQKKVHYLYFSCLNSHDRSMAKKLEAITDRIEHIVGQKHALNLEKSRGMETLSWRPPVISDVNVSEVHGRLKEKEDIIKLMFNGEGDQMLSVIPIVGMGGVGKTTLVQLVYKELKQKFDLTVWVCVSEAFDFLKIAQTIIKSISPDFVCDNMDLNLLQLHLAEKLERKKFLIVLDDVWNDKYTEWVTLKNLLFNGGEGCKILVTTRLERVALMVKTISSFYRLNVLSDKDCLSIFSTHAFHFRDSSTVNSCVEKFGRDVARKCKGLPLAAKVLGGLFRSKPDFEDWNIILKDSMWNSLDKEIIPTLKVSYYYLPPHLKQCFAYCSLFPKDYQFDKKEMVLMWIAEGFFQPSKGNMMTLEEVGYGYIDDLTSRSLFQTLPKDDVHFDLEHKTIDHGCFVMHDLIHELATHVAGDFYFRLGGRGNKISNMTRHLSCNYQNYTCLDHGIFQELKGLRTFIGLNFSNIPRSIGNDFHILPSNMKYLRTLSLRDLSALKIIPDSIGEFIHLRYLDLSKTCVESLPNSICKLKNLQLLKLCDCNFLKILPSDMQNLVNLRHLDVSWSIIATLPNSLCKLCNLQTLMLHNCESLKMLPSDMQDLTNLRHLDVRGTPLKEMPRGLGNLKDLRFLSDFVVGKELEFGIGELGGMSNLKGWIVINKLENVMNGNQAYEARMMEKKIKGLTLSWSEYGDVKYSTIERDILANLQPHWDLEALKIECYRGTIFPDWLGSHSYHNMTWLELKDCQNCCMLPVLGQLPTLKKLYIYKLKRVVSIGDELLKGNDCASMIPFPSLEDLTFSWMTSWEQWHSIDMEVFPKLQQLQIFHCDKLVGNLPCQLLSLETLRIVFCPLFSSCIPRCPKLQNLDIKGSGNVVWQEQQLHPTLCKLGVSGGWMFEALSEYSQLQQLTISYCSNTSSIIHLPPSLQHIIINDCENVDFTMSSNAPHQNLQSITLKSCGFVKFTSDDMEALLPNLRKLCIVRHKVEAFPEGIHVPSLRELLIQYSEKLVSHHAKWHLPSNITYLSIYCPYGNEVKCFPDGCSLPTSLTTLELCDCGFLETLNCTGLLHLASLQQLKILCCSKLEKMSGEKLPSSLKKLHIWECPLLEEKYYNKDEQLLCKISHIPLINLFRK